VELIIIEDSLGDFQPISILDQTQKRLMANTINFSAPTSCIINAFQKQSHLRPKLKKIGIYVKLIFKNTQDFLEERFFRQILSQYLEDIGWSDLQYVSFITYSQNSIQIDIIFNRVISPSQIIDLKCLKATKRQYKILRQAYIKTCNSIEKIYV
jgi:hypothetical protein